MSFYDASVRDAIVAVSAFVERSDKGSKNGAVGKRLLARLNRLADERDERANALQDLGGPETLLHGDPWPKNMAVTNGGVSRAVRLIDWDHVGPGSFSYDLSALVYRVPADHRSHVIDLYRRAAAEHEVRIPGERELDGLFATAEFARLANIAIWPAIVATEDGSRWAIDELGAIDEWFDLVESRCGD